MVSIRIRSQGFLRGGKSFCRVPATGLNPPEPAVLMRTGKGLMSPGYCGIDACGSSNINTSRDAQGEGSTRAGLGRRMCEWFEVRGRRSGNVRVSIQEDGRRSCQEPAVGLKPPPGVAERATARS